MSLSAPVVSAADLIDEIAPAPATASEVVFPGRVWDVVRDRVDLGSAGTVVREYVEHPGAVAVLALRQDRGTEEILLIRQYRHPIGAWEWELPAGLLDVSGEEPWVGAARELAEEADLRADRWDLLSEYVASPGGMNEALRIYLARDLSDVPAVERHVRTEEEADLAVRWAPLEAVLAAVRSGAMRNAAAIIGAYAINEVIRRDWEGLRGIDEPWPAHPSSSRRGARPGL